MLLAAMLSDNRAMYSPIRPSGGEHEDVEEEAIVTIQLCLPKFRSQSGQKCTGRNAE